MLRKKESSAFPKAEISHCLNGVIYKRLLNTSVLRQIFCCITEVFVFYGEMHETIMHKMHINLIGLIYTIAKYMLFLLTNSNL